MAEDPSQDSVLPVVQQGGYHARPRDRNLRPAIIIAAAACGLASGGAALWLFFGPSQSAPVRAPLAVKSQDLLFGGSLYLTKDQLRAKYGEPHWQGISESQQAEWRYNTSDGQVTLIFNGEEAVRVNSIGELGEASLAPAR